MSKHLLTIRSKDRWIYQAIKSGRKKFETRAATDKYQKIKCHGLLAFELNQSFKIKNMPTKTTIYQPSRENFTGEVCLIWLAAKSPRQEIH